MQFPVVDLCSKAREVLPEGGPFSYPNLYRWKTHIEGSLIHAILNATWKPYRDGVYEGKSLDRINVVRELRSLLADRLGQLANGPNSSNYYQLLSKGGFVEKAKTEPEFSLEKMKLALRTASFLGEIFLEYLSNYFNIDIFVINLKTMEVTLTQTEDYLLFTRSRDCVILGFINNHYELISVKVSDKEWPTIFSPQAPIIRKLWQRRVYLRS